MTIDAPVFPAESDSRTGRPTSTPSAGSHAEYSASVQMRTPHDHRRPRIPSRVRLRTGRPTSTPSAGSHAEYSASVQRGRLMTIDAPVFPAESDSVREDPPPLPRQARTRNIPPPCRETPPSHKRSRTQRAPPEGKTADASAISSFTNPNIPLTQHRGSA